MDSGPFLIDAFINNQFYLCALFDSGCLPYAAFNEKTVIDQNLPRIPINHRLLKLAKDDKVCFKIKYITYATLDINGRKERLWGYVIPGLHYGLILGKGWAERNNAIYKAGEHLLSIGQNNQQIQVYEKGWTKNSPATNTLYIKQAKLVSALVFSAYTKKSAA